MQHLTGAVGGVQHDFGQPGHLRIAGPGSRVMPQLDQRAIVRAQPVLKPRAFNLRHIPRP